MLNKLFKSCILIGCLLVSCSQALGADVTNLHGQRYCEILIAYQRTIPLQVYVYNTIGLNDCPEQIWRSLSTEEIKRNNKAFMVKLNGPRVWVIDGMKNSQLVDDKVVSFNGLTMRAAAILQLKALDLIQGQKPYTQHQVKRKTTWVYKPGSQIYELIDPKGNVFVMQSFSLQKRDLSLQDLDHLNSLLTLPEGWRFQMRTIKETALLTPINELATVIQDDLLNTYQLETNTFQP